MHFHVSSLLCALFFSVFTSCLVLFYWSKFWVTALFLMRLDLAGAQACYNNPGAPDGVITYTKLCFRSLKCGFYVV